MTLRRTTRTSTPAARRANTPRTFRTAAPRTLFAAVAALGCLTAGLTAPAAAANTKAYESAGTASTHRPGQTRSEGCGQQPPVPPGESTRQTLSSGGHERSYLVHLPASYDPGEPQPVVLSFHGHGRTSEYQESLTDMSALDALVVYPQGLTGTDGESAWQGAPYSAEADDVAFTGELLDLLEAQFCVDTTREYAAGKSNGGGFAGLLGCRLSARLAAVAPVSGAFYPQGGPCEPERPVPVLDFHGQQDTTIPYTGDPAKGLPPLQDWLTGWASRENCDAAPETTAPWPHVSRQRWTGCAEGSEVVHYAVSDLGHDWPSTTPNEDSEVPTTFDATPLIWEFFQQHRLEPGA
ncbi:alpha/beta hydrolase family esterase [Streptomyces sp. SCSIO ZS0520]|uniref:alpha/beta hydrolase family esterase n=1 Tax=Streptomyces sp. SCSIO ZS0520 TaxID=2892996 RepID=UPI0021DA448F|nr:PHB depolymerase family esterase [Streptomyces sp. SCSIO ZS0520]